MPKDFTSPSFLDVEASLTGRRWIGPGVETLRRTEAMAQETGLPPLLAGVLARRGVASADAEAHLSPTLRDLLPDPMRLHDMGAAADRLISAVAARQRVAVFADYDVDGAASAALLATWLRSVGSDLTIYVPDRIDEGYGPNAGAMTMLARSHDLILCVDCGTLSHDAIAAVTDADVIVIDHHTATPDLPRCAAVVNPNRQDEDGTLSHLCAAAVVFLVLVEANRRLRPAPCPDLMGMLDLVGLATVADLAPLAGVNRAFVRQGLSVMARRARPGLVALADIARLDCAPTAHHLGFVLGPRINAGGRVGRADLGARLLTTQDAAEAASLAEMLDRHNTDRRAIEAAVRDAALAQSAARGDGPLAWAAGDGWHPGVVGIVAARLGQATGRPAVVIGLDGDVGKGSGRSVPGVDLGSAIHRLVEEGLLEKGGGHPMAAGLTLRRASLAPAMARLADLLQRQGAGSGGMAGLALDAALMTGAAMPDLVDAIDRGGPYGMGAPAPRIALPDCAIRHARRVGDAHLKLSVDNDGSALDVIAFGALDGPLGAGLEAHGGRRFHLAGRLETNRWQGRTTAQLRLEDAAAA